MQSLYLLRFTLLNIRYLFISEHLSAIHIFMSEYPVNVYTFMRESSKKGKGPCKLTIHRDPFTLRHQDRSEFFCSIRQHTRKVHIQRLSPKRCFPTHLSAPQNSLSRQILHNRTRLLLQQARPGLLSLQPARQFPLQAHC